MSDHMSYKFYVELCDFEPKIWRRFQVAGEMTIARFGFLVQALFEMDGSHLMSIEVLNEKDEPIRHFEIMNDEFYDYSKERDIGDVENALAYKLYNILSAARKRFRVRYDFGDDWCLSVIVEETLRAGVIPVKELPRVIDGVGYGIVENVGGSHGLKVMANAFSEKKGALYTQYRKQLGRSDFDITAFDIDAKNAQLKKITRIY